MGDARDGTPAGASPRRWRVDPLTRKCAIVLVSLLAFFAVANAVDGDSEASLTLGFCVAFVCAFVWHPFVAIEGDDLVVRNVIRTRRFRRTDVRCVLPSQYGLSVYTLGRGMIASEISTVTASAVVKSPLSAGKVRRADLVVDEIKAWVTGVPAPERALNSKRVDDEPFDLGLPTWPQRQDPKPRT